MQGKAAKCCECSADADAAEGEAAEDDAAADGDAEEEAEDDAGEEEKAEDDAADGEDKEELPEGNSWDLINNSSIQLLSTVDCHI